MKFLELKNSSTTVDTELLQNNFILTQPKYAKGSMDKHCIAVTALSKKEHHLERQQSCLDSWLRLGLSIYAVNTSEEIKELNKKYSQVSRWIESNEVAVEYENPTQYIRRLCEVSVELDYPIILINSDIELYGSQDAIISKIKPRTLLGGIRHNYDLSPDKHKREEWGLDLFYLTPAMVNTLPFLPLGIGKPMWDYWLPFHFRKYGYTIDLIGEPFLYHKSHSLLWTAKNWEWGRDVIQKHYFSNTDFSKAFRKSLPFPPATNSSYY